MLLRTAPGAAAARRGAADGARRPLSGPAGRRPGTTSRCAWTHNREANDWLLRILSVILFAFTAIAVVNTLMMIGLHRHRELALLRLVGATPRQIRAMARWEGAAIVTLGVGLGGGIALVTLMPTAALLSGSAVPYAPVGLVAWSSDPPPPSASSAASWPAASRCGRARWTRWGFGCNCRAVSPTSGLRVGSPLHAAVAALGVISFPKSVRSAM